MKLILKEPGSDDVQSLFRQASVVASVRIAYAELRATIAAARRERRLTARTADAARDELERVWSATSIVEVDEPLVLLAGTLADQQALRGYDAIHLAGVVRFGTAADVEHVACWDRALARAATSLGYSIFPAEEPAPS